MAWASECFESTKVLGGSKNPRGANGNVGGLICPMVDTGLTDLPKSRGVMVPPDPTGLSTMRAAGRGCKGPSIKDVGIF
jgi:hypothetical protein